MANAQTLVDLPSLLNRFFKSQYKAGAETVIPEDGATFSWLEEVQYLLRNCDQSSRIRFAIADLRGGF